MYDRAMPRGDFKRFPSDPTAVYQCPCGFQGTSTEIASHRRWHPTADCATIDLGRGKGKSILLVGVVRPPVVSDSPPPDPKAVEPKEDTPNDDTPKLEEDEAPPELVRARAAEVNVELPAEPTDPEELARRLLAERSQGTPGGNGNGHGLALEGFDLEPLAGVPIVSEDRVTVGLPIALRIYYDWARQRGWFEGDGSFAAFITAVMLDYFRNVLGIALAVVNREDVIFDNATTSNNRS